MLADLGAPALPPQCPLSQSRPIWQQPAAHAHVPHISAESAFSWHQRLFVWQPVARLPSPLLARSPQGASHGFLGFSGPDCSQKGASWAGHLPPQCCLRGLEAAPPCRRLIGAHASRTARPIPSGMVSPPSWAPGTPPPKLQGQGPLLPHSAQRGRLRQGVSASPQCLLTTPTRRAAPVPPKNRSMPTAFCTPSGVIRGQ